MTYASQDDLTQRFGEAELVQLTDPMGAGVADAAVIAVALTDADQVINGYVAARYAVPLAPVPDLVRRWACDLARYFLHSAGVPELVEKNYLAAVAGLKDVAKGIVRLEAAGLSATTAPADDFGALVDAAPRVFDARNLDDF